MYATLQVHHPIDNEHTALAPLTPSLLDSHRPQCVAHFVERRGIDLGPIEAMIRILFLELHCQEAAPQNGRVVIGPKFTRGAGSVPFNDNSHETRRGARVVAMLDYVL